MDVVLIDSIAGLSIQYDSESSPVKLIVKLNVKLKREIKWCSILKVDALRRSVRIKPWRTKSREFWPNLDILKKRRYPLSKIDRKHF